MANKLYNEQSVQAIADAIRSVSGSTDTYKISEMAAAVAGISTSLDWAELGYDTTGPDKGMPIELIDAFNYSKNIKDNWTQISSYYGDKNLYFFPNVDLIIDSSEVPQFYNGMFQNTNLIHIDPVTIGHNFQVSGFTDANSMFRNTYVKSVTISSVNDNETYNLNNMFDACAFLQSVNISLKAYSVNYMFLGCKNLLSVNDNFDTSIVTQFNEVFHDCSNIKNIPNINTSNGTSFYRTFQGCIELENAPNWNLTNATGLEQMFWNCAKLKNVPYYQIPNVTNMTNMFQNIGTDLTETSRENILKMCISATSYNNTKTLSRLGLTMYQSSDWTSLPSYNDFIDAGWSIS